MIPLIDVIRTNIFQGSFTALGKGTHPLNDLVRSVRPEVMLPLILSIRWEVRNDAT